MSDAATETNDATDGQLPWPRPGRSLFQRDRDWWFNACLSSVRGRANAYAQGYLRAATVLFEHVAETHNDVDTLLLPLVFVWRQALELQLKQIIAGTRELDGEGDVVATGHDVVRLWTEARARLDSMESGHDVELDAVGSIITQLARVDPRATGFRYAAEIGGGATLATAPDLVNLRNLHDVMSEVTTFFECALLEIGRRLDWVREREAEMERE